MTIEDRNLTPGTILTATYKGQAYTCKVVQGEDGLRYRLEDGPEYKSPSAAGSKVLGGMACNGWRFWSVNGAAPAPTAAAKAPKAKKAPKPTKHGKKAAIQEKHDGRSRGDRYGCGACSQEFGTLKAATTHAMTHTTA